MSPLMRRLAAAGTTLALALPAPALAHHGHHGFRHHGFGVPCHALEAGKTVKWMTADQASALKDACTTRDNAIKAANAQFKAATADDLATYKAAVAPAKASVKSAWTALRSACKGDHHSQACKDAWTAYRTAVTNALPTFRAAWTAYVTATRPAATARASSVRAAQKAFHDAAAKVFA